MGEEAEESQLFPSKFRSSLLSVAEDSWTEQSQIALDPERNGGEERVLDPERTHGEWRSPPTPWQREERLRRWLCGQFPLHWRQFLLLSRDYR